ncbi:hypothetical protein V8J36_14935 [Frigidibacter sp. MR17.14]|uniref:hypothetical protein n=1 Tax=Frigidibacter sp. MR17.14 TaxID=3126509 RepID=UPI003012CCD7
MFDPSDPRAGLAVAKSSAVAPGRFFPAELGLFHDAPPQIDDATGQTWFLRGANFVIALTRALPGASFAREAQPDEYVVLLDAPDTRAVIEAQGAAGAERVEVPGHSLAFVPPGASRVTLPEGGLLVRLFTARAADMVAACPNAAAYDPPHARIPAFAAWPAPADGWRIRHYSLDVPPTPGRFGRIFRCTTFMVNMLDPQIGPRDITKLSPHHHDEFEQLSLCLAGRFVHHLRWPWTVDLNDWRADEAIEVGAPSATVIPPPAIHTSRGTDPGLNQLVDVFCPPRVDFSEKPGWVLNAADYPMPATEPAGEEA